MMNLDDCMEAIHNIYRYRDYKPFESLGFGWLVAVLMECMSEEVKECDKCMYCEKRKR